MERLRAQFPDLEPARILYTPNFASRAELAWALQSGVRVTVDNSYMLANWPQLFAGQDIFVRLDTGVGRGHHDHVRTAGTRSKFGVQLSEVRMLAGLAQAAGARIVGLQAHVGSGIFDVTSWEHTARVLAQAARGLEDLRVIDVGGGLGVPEQPDQPPVDLGKLDTLLLAVRAEHPQLEVWLEPGRFFVAAAGVLLARVTQLKSKGGVRFVGVATGMNSLIRPALYGAYHEIANLTRAEDAATELVEHRRSHLRERRRARARPAAAADPRGRRARDRQRRGLRACHELALQPARAGHGAVHLKRLMLFVGAAAALAIAGYLFYLDRLVTRQFEGRRWTLPAQVYAAPLELYAGAPLHRAAVRGGAAPAALPARGLRRATRHLSAERR